MKKYKYSKTITIDGKRYNIRADTLEQLGAKIAMKKRDIEEGRVLVTGSMTVDQWAEICTDTYRQNIGQKYREAIQSRYKNYISPVIGKYQVRQVKPIHCQKIMNQAEGFSYGFTKKLTLELKFLFRMAIKNRLILESPAEDVIKPNNPYKSRRALTRFEREHFLKVCAENDKFLIFELMLYCGCRPSEAMRCIGSDLSVIDGFPMLHIRGTKTRLSDRIVPVPDPLWQRLRGVHPFSLLAPGKNGVMTDNEFWARTKALKRAMNISMGCRVYNNQLVPPLPLAPDFVPYCLRHTYCTDLQRAGVDVRIAQKLMGHANIQMTVNIYTHVDTESIVDAARVLGVTPEYTPTTGTLGK